MNFSQKRKQLRKKRRFRERLVILSLLVLLIGSLSILLLTMPESTKTSLKNLPSLLLKNTQPSVVPIYRKNQTVVLSEEIKNSVDLSYYQQVARVTDIILPKSVFDKKVRYVLSFANDQKLSDIDEAMILPMETTLTFNQSVELVGDNDFGNGYIHQINRPISEEDDVTYVIKFPEQELSQEASLSDIIPIFQIPLSSSNDGIGNQQVIQQYIDRAKDFSAVVLDFPTGNFLIGSSDEEKNYLLLASNVWLRGNQTTLIVDNEARWFGLATGTSAYDGVANFSMTGLDIVAKDLEKGARFLVMPNHGSNWYVSDNSFTMVHAIGSHVFDLGALQDSVFSYNRFIGYAPELLHVDTIEGREPHDFYAEAIQLDVSDANVPWDGGMLTKIDPNYNSHSQERLMSSNIVIAYNEFLPYYDSEGKLRAYSASIGQHSSEVGYVAIYGNIFNNSLVKRYQVTGELAWFFEPILIRSFDSVDIYDNSIVE